MIYEGSRTPSPFRFTVFKAHTVRRTILLYSVNNLQKNRFKKKKKKGGYGSLEILIVRLVPESGKQLAPGAAAFQNSWS